MSDWNCHVISNTHWDREWRYPFQSYRMALVDMLDKLLDILEKHPEYHSFFLDSQTVILEDYLQIRPENSERVKKLVQSDRLQIGPWYTLPDEWGCPGEALVRNLLRGHKSAKEFGPVAKVGYTPFSNGQISQLPQLYQGFGIDSCFFYRGVGKHLAKSEFIWKSPDGTEVFGFRFGDYARYNYYFLIYRPGLLGRTTADREYKWTPEEVPYRVASDQSQDFQYDWINQKLTVNKDKIKQALEDSRKYTRADATTSELLYMMGHDHSYAAEEEIDLISACQDHLEPGENLFHSSLAEYMKTFREKAKDLQVLEGEMRHTNKEGLWTNLMALILSCRLYLKQRNARVNAQIIYGAEPLAACAWLTGSEYPAPYLDEAWKWILINQAHDAIGGCSVDKVHREMLTRWDEVETISEEICRGSMRDLVSRIDASAINSDDLQLTVFNTLPYERSGIAEFTIDLPNANEEEILSAETIDGETVPLQILSSESYSPTIESGYELPLPFIVRRFRVKLQLSNLPAMGYRAYVIKKTKKATASAGQSILKSDRELDNGIINLKVNKNGTLKLTDKKTGHITDNLCYFEDSAEFGDPWNRVVPENDIPIFSLDAKAHVKTVHSGSLEGKLEIKYHLSVPAGKNGDNSRSKDAVDIPITVLVSLRNDSPLAYVTVHLENKAKDHRLRLMFPSNISHAENSYAEGQFDVLARPIKLPASEGWKEAPYPTHPMWNFAGVGDGKRGLAVINDGLTEYEAVDDELRTIAVTLIRAFGKFVFDRPVPEAQCPGKHNYNFAIYPHEGEWSDSAVLMETAKFITPLQAVESAPSRGESPLEKSFFSLTPGSVVFSGIKQGEDGESVIIRLWNPYSSKRDVKLKTGQPVKEAFYLTLEEKIVKELEVDDDNIISFTALPKKIITIGLRF